MFYLNFGAKANKYSNSFQQMCFLFLKLRLWHGKIEEKSQGCNRVRINSTAKTN